MGKPSPHRCAALVENGRGFDIRLSRVGVGPLVQIWVNEEGRGGRSIILTTDQSDEFIEAWQDMLDEIDNDSSLEVG